MAKVKSRRFHLVLDISAINPFWLIGPNKKEFLGDIIESLCCMIGMKILHGPVIINGKPENPGLTAFCVIDFSHISIHTFTETNEACVDIFSCKQFDYEKVYNYVKKTFQVEDKNIRRAVVTYSRRKLW